ncbi:MAG: biotin--[acetyl-CoA-carboxylase] ligase [Waddliaceae bacterium]
MMIAKGVVFLDISSKENLEFARYHFSAIDSTNTWAKNNTHLFDPSKITLVTAYSQSAGRGRSSRQWKSPAKQNIYASFCFVMPKESPNLSNITQIMAISVLETLDSIGFKAKVKWPNDLLLSGKKVGGILCEILNQRGLIWVILGIGININMPQELLQTIDQPATSLLVESGTPLEIGMITQKLQKHFVRNLKIFLEKGFSPFLSDYKAKLVHSPQQLLHFKQDDQEWEGVFHSINDDGSLSLKLESGEIKKIFSGEIT